MTLDEALGALKARAQEGRAEGMAAYHKMPRTYLGLANGDIDDLAKDWRRTLDLDTRLRLASELWDTDIYEGRLAAAKLLTQARIKPDDSGAWDLLCKWVPEFDSWAIADHACMAGHRRVVADPARLDEVERWTQSDHMWTRRAALVITLPWTKQRNPKPAELAARERILGWAALYVPDTQWFIQKSIAWWLRELGKRDPDRVRAFLTEHGAQMKPFAAKEAARKLPPA